MLFVESIVRSNEFEPRANRRQLAHHFSSVRVVDITFLFEVEEVAALQILHRTASQIAHVEAVRPDDIEGLCKSAGFILDCKDQNEVFVFANF